VNLDEVKQRLEAVIKEHEANDPKALRKEIARLQTALNEAHKDHERAEQRAATKEKIVEKAVLKDGQLARAEKVIDRAEKLCTQHRDNLLELHSSLTAALHPICAALESISRSNARGQQPLVNGEPVGGGTRSALEAAAGRRPLPTSPPQVTPKREGRGTAPHNAPSVSGGGRDTSAALADGDTISRPQQRILDALASLHSLGLGAVSKSNVGVFADASPTSSSFVNNLGRLRSLGLIEYPQQGAVRLTSAGAAIASPGMGILSRADLHRAWFSKLPNPKVRILEQLIATYPDALTKDELAARAGASPTSSSYVNNLGNLRSLGLIDYPQQGYVAATDLLFPEGLA
jgi:hypothetical protein